ncbi:MAG: hypothetical protein EWV58_07855 [Microcystis aeruginosa Ma_MB_F_20061100_S19]|uniref:DUF2281 domain-containing protein n=1 Tax=Microcystis aeruginosa SPC777 TaxID=482300 RepID=S3IZI8_MICAE|nr:hypothetical protein [Microcystis aeruginosa]NCR96525.1 hypothetical protein [Microcystis aeruginosa L311-01]OCY12249.1 MAG: hypothetical protein BEV12_02640 [Microcystis aeruginosa CACIAM 03]TRU11627.1 MAG: hypothetical protein EWV59_10245 [Microcystis aeruginosa Ma_MB_F_20061100_S19D]TRU16300.1 MAG: hypothetical protein EWV58_07855 [Microcystis aeruginosa Ma_MB_F_20061100_S19]EPF18365.1 hypothetical protein MAESPC_04511 [Microcystis aeruginosa SPC777]
MSVTHINNLQDQILQSIKTLPLEKQQQVLEFVKSLQRNSRFQKWDNISDAEAQSLQNEFAQEDISFLESILPDYLSHLEQEDKE